MGAFFRDTRERGLKALVVYSLSAMMSSIYAVFGRFLATAKIQIFSDIALKLVLMFIGVNGYGLWVIGFNVYWL